MSPIKKVRQVKRTSSGACRTGRQVTLSTVLKSKDARQDFVLDYVKLCTIADIPLEKTERMSPFLRKYCAQAGALPQIDQLRSTYVPRVFEAYFTALKDILKGQPVSLTADETTDIRDHSILNVIATVRGRPYLIDVGSLQPLNIQSSHHSGSHWCRHCI